MTKNNNTTSVIVKPNASDNPKAPAFRMLVSVLGAVLEFPVFQRDGEFTVSLPGGRFPNLKPAPKIIEHEGAVYVTEPGSDAIDALDYLKRELAGAFRRFRESGDVAQTITLR